jgi:hypothetical protein
MNETPKIIQCPECKVDIGTVTLVPVVGKPGFFVNVCDPNPLPQYCGVCNNVLIRKPEPILEGVADVRRRERLSSVRR